MTVSVSSLLERDETLEPIEPQVDRTFSGLDAPRRRLITSGAAVLAVGSLAGAAIMFTDPVSVPAGAQALEGGYPGRTVPGRLGGPPGDLGTIHPMVFTGLPAGPAAGGMPASARDRGLRSTLPIGERPAATVVSSTPAPAPGPGGVVGGGGPVGDAAEAIASMGDRLGGPLSALGDTAPGGYTGGGRHALRKPIGSSAERAPDSPVQRTVSSLIDGVRSNGTGDARHRTGTGTHPKPGLTRSVSGTLSKAAAEPRRSDGSSRSRSTTRRDSDGDLVSSVSRSLLGRPSGQGRDDDRDDDRRSERRSESKRGSDGDAKRRGSGRLGSLLSGHDD